MFLPFSPQADANDLPLMSAPDWFLVGRAVDGRYGKFAFQRDATPENFGAVGDGVADDTAAFEALFAHADATGAAIYVPAGEYLITHVRNRTLANSLRVVCHPDAKFIGAPTLVNVAGTGANTSYTVTEFPKAVAGYALALISGGVVTGWTEGVEFTTTGTTVDWSVGSSPHGALSVGDTIRIVSAGPMIELGQGTGTARNRFYWQGGYFDNSQRGFVPQRASGSGLTIREFASVEVVGATFWCADSYVDAQAAGVGDSGLTTINCDAPYVHGNTFQGQSDLGYYLSGGASTGPEDDGIGALVIGNTFIRCLAGGKGERQARGVIVRDNHFMECRVGWLAAGLAGGGGPVGGGQITISGNRGTRIGASMVDLRKVSDAVITDNVVEDYGYLPDGVTVVPLARAINVAGVENGIVRGNIVRLKDWTATDQQGICLRPESTGTTVETTQVVVEGNTVIGAATSFVETGSGTGNVWRENTTYDEIAAVSVPSTRRWHYRKSNLQFEGIGATPFEGPWTPEFRIGGTAPSMTITTQYGRYSRSGNVVEFECLLQVNPTFTPSGGQLRIYGLPFQALSTANNKGAGVLNGHAGLTYPAGVTTVHAQIPNATGLANTFIRLNGVGSGIGGGSLTDAQIVSGAAFRVDIRGSYAVEPEAQN